MDWMTITGALFVNVMAIVDMTVLRKVFGRRSRWGIYILLWFLHPAVDWPILVSPL